jgi:Matrixin
MLERRLMAVVSGAVVFLVSALLWNAFVHPRPRPVPSPRPLVPTAVRTAVESAGAGSAAPGAPATPTAQPFGGAASPQQVETGGPSYIVLLARSEIRRRIRASASLTYLNEIVAASPDSALHRWDGRVATPVRVSLVAGTVANFQPAFLDAVRGALERWRDAGVPIRFNLDADSSMAEVRFHWRIQFEGERSGQTDLQWDSEGHITRGDITLATFDLKGQPLDADGVRVMALHEIGHLLGLDHSPDTGDIMYPTPRVRDLSPRDIATALLLYDLAPGSLRVGR